MYSSHTHPLEYPWYIYIPIAMFLTTVVMLPISIEKYDEDQQNYRNEFWHNDCHIVNSQVVKTSCGFDDNICDPLYNLFCTYSATEPSPNVTQMLLLMTSYDENTIIDEQDKSCVVNNFVKCYVNKQSENLQLSILDEVTSDWALGIALSSIFMAILGIFVILPYMLEVYSYCRYVKNVNQETRQLINA